MPALQIKSVTVRRIARLAARRKRSPQRVLDAALAAGLDYEEWFQREVAKGLAELDAGKALSHEQMLKNQARRKAALVRSLAKAA
jgi:predicted transcriptional regulator